MESETRSSSGSGYPSGPSVRTAALGARRSVSLAVRPSGSGRSVLREVGHTAAVREVAEEYERRVVGFLDEALLERGTS